MEYGPSLGGTPYVGQPIGLPVNFGMRLTTDEQEKDAGAKMTESEKERIILKCQDADSQAEREKIVESMVPDGNVNYLYEHQERTAEG